MHNFSNVQNKIVVAGSGLAGLMATMEAAKQGLQVKLICGTSFGSGATFSPIKGTLGMQITGEADQGKFLEDITEIGRGFAQEEIAKIYVAESPKAVAKLKELGFDIRLRQDNRPACFAKYPRPIYLLANWQKSKKAIKRKLLSYPNVEIIEQGEVVKIFTDKLGVAAVAIFDGEEIKIEYTRGLIMATGGIAGLFTNSLYPPEVAGVGHGLLLDAGAELTNMEFIQFIPAFTKPKYNLLFGEHTLRYGRGIFADNGELLYPGIDQDNYEKIWQQRSGYAPFSADFPSRAWDFALVDIGEMTKGNYNLEFSPELYDNEEDFYTTYLNWLSTMGIDLRLPSTIAHFAHSCNGGAVVNTNSATKVKGLYAVGELMAGAEGANRLGGNSIGQGAIMGERAIKDWLSLKLDKALVDEQEIDLAKRNWESQVAEGNISSLAVLSKAMDKGAKVIRNAQELLINKQALIADNEEIQGPERIKLYYQKLTVLAIFEAILAQKASVGAHYRKDYPQALGLKQSFISYHKGRFKLRFKELTD